MSEEKLDDESNESPRLSSRRTVLTGIGATGLLSTTGITTAAPPRSRGRRDPMNLELKRGKLRVGANAPRSSEMANVSNQAKRYDGGGPSEISVADVEAVINEFNEAQENGKLEFFEKGGVVHVRPTDKQLSQVRR